VAIKLTTVANAILLQYGAPVWIALFGSLFLAEKARRLDWITIFVALAGMILFLADGLSTGNVWGDIFGVLSGIFFAGMIIALRAQKDGSPVESIILGNLLAFAIGLPSMVSGGNLSGSGWGALAILGCVQLGVSYHVYSRAIKHVTALQAVLIPVIEPLLNPIWVLIVMGERPTPVAIVGGAIVLGAITTRSIISIRDRNRAPV
jgi:drug/metabolite transporter (DMT)-like permease